MFFLEVSGYFDECFVMEVRHIKGKLDKQPKVTLTPLPLYIFHTSIFFPWLNMYDRYIGSSYMHWLAPICGSPICITVQIKLQKINGGKNVTFTKSAIVCRLRNYDSWNLLETKIKAFSKLKLSRLFSQFTFVLQQVAYRKAIVFVKWHRRWGLSPLPPLYY